MAMAVCNSWQWHALLRSLIILLCSLFFFFTLCHFPLILATPLSFNLTNINQTLLNHEILVDGDANITDQGIQLTPITDPQQKAGRATYKDPLYLGEKASGNRTDFNTYFLFVIDSNGSTNYGDGLAFFLVPHGYSPSKAPGGAFGLPIDPKTIQPTISFVAVEFDTFPNKGLDPNYGYPGTHHYKKMQHW